ncbi:peroxidase 60-like isoform X2 [Citrus clementina]|uniref:peroxidase 60-like isoform X2 n=1 Tax=Citrus clementina TaxID=85681 RepID=UPI000CED2F33|nr:peroxidase 60-like isoform X2 [Citrus x clementina]
MSERVDHIWKTKKVKQAVALLILRQCLLANIAGLSHGALQVGFYRGKCGIADVEMIVAGVVTARFFRDPTVVAALIRLQFHDCFVNGGGGRYEVQTGRRDGLVSLAQNVSISIPGPSASIPQTMAVFANKGLNLTDMVLLMGGHSVGVAHCSIFKDRLYNFRSTGRPDPTMDSFLANKLRARCPLDTTTTTTTTTANNTVDLDQNPFQIPFLDNSYYRQLMLNRGVLEIDQELALHPLTRATVMSIANALDFPIQFGAAMVKMGAIEVLTGMQGEIRRFCTATNWPPFT